MNITWEHAFISWENDERQISNHRVVDILVINLFPDLQFVPYLKLFDSFNCYSRITECSTSNNKTKYGFGQKLFSIDIHFVRDQRLEDFQI